MNYKPADINPCLFLGFELDCIEHLKNYYITNKTAII